MMFNILKDYHVMIGVDFHKAVLPPPAPPVPNLPHACIAPLCIPPWGGLTGKPNGSVFSSGLGRTMSQGTDIGSLIPHIPLPPPNLLLPIIILTSGSKSEFGAHAHVAPEGPVAFAVLKVINLNLNCAGPACPPLPTGVVITFNTNTTGVTIGDIIAGCLRMVVDSALQYALNRIFASNTVSNFLDNLVLRGFEVFGPLVGRFAPAALGAFIKGYVFSSLFSTTVENILGALAADVIGSPLGYSPGWSPVGGFLGNAEDQGQSKVQQAVDNYFNNPAVDQHPSQPPAQPQPPAPPPTASSPDAGTPPPAPSSSAPDPATSTSTSPPPGPSSSSSSPTTPQSGGVCDPSDPDSL